MGDSTLSVRSLAITRLAIGGLQGLALYLIYVAYDERTWPATNGLFFAPLLLMSLFVPLLVSQALGTMRWRTLLMWTGAAAFAIGSLAFYDIWHDWPVDWAWGEPPVSRAHVVPSPQLFCALVAGLFIAQSLISGGDADRKWIAHYTTYFDVAWKLAVQGALATAFVGAFWGLLWLGAGLFDLINIGVIQELIKERWFAIPATALAFSAATHVTDVRAGIVRGIRTLGLTLLSWLLPLMALIGAGFLAALMFTGVQPLWDTQVATTLLLTAFGALVVLLNAAYQDGHADRAPSGVLRYAGSVAALTLVPLAALASYAVFLRVQQYGWTAPRIYAAACVMLAAFYAAGYAYAVLGSGPWLKRIEPWNIRGALLALAVLLALFTPIADPYRISVASQVARLESGAVTPEKFDYAHLRWSGGRYGQAALASLSAKTDGQGTEYLRDAASRALASTGYEPAFGYGASLNREIGKLDITVHPASAALPETFLAQSWGGFSNANGYVPAVYCLGRIPNARCDAWMRDLDADGVEEVVLLEGGNIYVFHLTRPDLWAYAGNWNLPYNCPRLPREMATDNFATMPPNPSRWPDLEISGIRFRLLENDPIPACPN